MRRNGTDGEALRAELTQALEAGVERIMGSDEFVAFLRAQACFHRYSFQNTLLILWQCPTATHVAGYRTWQGMGRQVRKGEKAIRIFAPMSRREEGEAGEDKTTTWFTLTSVFDISQTDGESLPAAPSVASLPGEDARAEALEGVLRGFLAGEGIAVAEGPLPAGARGCWYPAARRIVLAAGLGGVQRAKTLAHEAAHALDAASRSDADSETVAECAAYLVAAHCGLDTGAQSFGYVAVWAKDKAVFKTNLQRATAVAKRLVVAVEEAGETEGAAA